MTLMLSCRQNWEGERRRRRCGSRSARTDAAGGNVYEAESSKALKSHPDNQRVKDSDDDKNQGLMQTFN